MTTYREITSKVASLLKSNNRDEVIPRRFILKLLQDTATTLVSQKWLDRTIMSETNLYTQIPCFEFERVVAKKCSNVEFRRCDILMKSKCPLPKLIFSRLGASIKEIVSLDGNYRFVFLDKGQYQRNKNRQYSLKDEVYIYLDADNHLYIPDNEIMTVDLTILTLKTEDIKGCGCQEDEQCKSNWDYEFKCPDKLADTVFQQVIQMLGVSKQIREDSNPNGVQGN
jgi:hypothetical protein